ncbi:MAG TPA: glycosyltransferase family 25 protein [Chlamydiales bacterium]|nr:glycosyltransferase family 25 protein [Chlamydiales bacterium]
MRYLVLFCLVVSAFADIEDHFKKVTGKESYVSSMRNVDFIYLINLDQRPEKWAHCVESLAPYGILPYRFSAVNGWELSWEAIVDVGVPYEPWMDKGWVATWYPKDIEGRTENEVFGTPGKTYFMKGLTRGGIGITLSHLSILQDAWDSGYETIWIMEDDIEVIQNPHLISDLIEELDAVVGKKKWDVLFTDPDTKNQQGEYVPCPYFAWRPNFVPRNQHRFAQVEEVSPHLRKLGARYGAYSMIIRRSGIKKLLDFLINNHIFLPYDMEYTLPNTIRLFVSTQDIVSTQPQAATDNGTPNYLGR